MPGRHPRSYISSSSGTGCRTAAGATLVDQNLTLDNDAMAREAQWEKAVARARHVHASHMKGATQTAVHSVSDGSLTVGKESFTRRNIGLQLL